MTDYNLGDQPHHIVKRHVNVYFPPSLSEPTGHWELILHDVIETILPINTPQLAPGDTLTFTTSVTFS